MEVTPDPRRSLGSDGEAIAAAWYESAGHVVLDRNWRCREGELDLVVSRDGVVVFCEVKTRRSDAFGVPAEAVTRAKQQRIRALGARWLREHDVRARRVRFDVASILVRRGSRPVIDVISDAF
jgi:putative endonuclease